MRLCVTAYVGTPPPPGAAGKYWKRSRKVQEERVADVTRSGRSLSYDMRRTLRVLGWVSLAALGTQPELLSQAALTPADSAILNSQPLKRLVLAPALLDRKSTRLNSSHRCISYAVFCLKKKN